MKNYDIAVIGGGPGGYVAAIRSAQLGYKTVLFEGHKVGGVCLNYGCIPTKTLLKTAKLFKELKHASVFGIDVDITGAKLNWDKMMARKDKVVHQLTSGVASLLKHNGVDVIKDFAAAKSDTVLTCGGEDYTYEHLIIATGSTPSMPDIPGLKESYDAGIVIDSTGALAIAEMPKKMVILGGGVIAVEFATLYSSLGIEVTLIQRSSEILSTLDKDIKKTMQRHLKKTGVTIHTDTSIERIEGNSVYYSHRGETKVADGDYILASLGRRANLDGLEPLGLETYKRGIVVDPHLRTNKPNIYAIGDVNGNLMLAHVASAEAIVAVETIHGEGHPLNYDTIPSGIYSFPEVAVSGLTEEQATQKGYDVISSKFPIAVNGRALSEGESVGFVKLVAEKKYGEVLGIHIVAAHATDMISEAVVAMQLEGTVEDLARSVHPHPTLSEIVMEAAHGALGSPIHIKN